MKKCKHCGGEMTKTNSIKYCSTKCAYEVMSIKAKERKNKIMKYPRINKTDLDFINKKRFTNLYKMIYRQIEFDNKENQLKLSKGDIEILAWNSATIIISQPY